MTPGRRECSRGVDYENVAIQLGRTTTLGVISLHATPVMEPIVVTAERRGLDPSSAAIGANLATEECYDLPIDRNYMNIPTLPPEVNESYFGDGLNFAQEVQVKTGGYAAEYRSSLGGIVNVVSRSGGDEFHGQGFGFFINNQLTGSSRQEQADYALYDMGMSLGGPIKRDRLWFFGAYNPSFTREDVNVLGVGTREDKRVKHIFAGKRGIALVHREPVLQREQPCRPDRLGP